jgi:hypothetical protein
VRVIWRWQDVNLPFILTGVVVAQILLAYAVLWSSLPAESPTSELRTTTSFPDRSQSTTTAAARSAHSAARCQVGETMSDSSRPACISRQRLHARPDGHISAGRGCAPL